MGGGDDAGFGVTRWGDLSCKSSALLQRPSPTLPAPSSQQPNIKQLCLQLAAARLHNRRNENATRWRQQNFL